MKTLRTCTSYLAIPATVAFFMIATSVSSYAQMCPMMWQPVCGIGKDGVKRTWANDCFAKNMTAKHLHPGMCK